MFYLTRHSESFLALCLEIIDCPANLLHGTWQGEPTFPVRKTETNIRLGSMEGEQRILTWKGAKTWHERVEERPPVGRQTWRSATSKVVMSSPGGSGSHRNGKLQEEKEGQIIALRRWRCWSTLTFTWVILCQGTTLDMQLRACYINITTHFSQ